MSSLLITNENIYEIRNLSVRFPSHQSILGFKTKYIEVLSSISFDVKRNEILGIVGESGCGKSTIAKSLLSLLKFETPYVKIDGSLQYKGKDSVIEILKCSEKQLGSFRKEVQIIFQDPATSLNPKLTVEAIVKEPMIVHKIYKAVELDKKFCFLLEKVGLNSDLKNKYPYELSGGQKQRIMLARALATNPSVLIADEPLSALDVSIQAQILNLFVQLQKEFKLTIIIISHDLSVIKYLCDRIIVMYLGSIVEMGESETLYNTPLHPYTKGLISAIPSVSKSALGNSNIRLTGEIPSLSKKPEGCVFYSRCPLKEKICKSSVPALDEKRDAQWVACHLV
ncbi:MAG: ABC transporter ATP-binding protein [Ignavibacteria bacterium]